MGVWQHQIVNTNGGTATDNRREQEDQGTSVSNNHNPIYSRTRWTVNHCQTVQDKVKFVFTISRMCCG